ncbi:putative nucleotidyltransferase [Rosa chinensis]|uniref:Putative nucleotidyltransferase n=1 Tax=Rosa chinensis TaxID=74649 RepID=A0A2P6RB45_ROSCH|nr:putative nucleotidyltransferase [Rosa chinensis]
MFSYLFVLYAIPGSLGVSATRQYHFNSLAVPRKAKEAIGGITRLTHADV